MRKISNEQLKEVLTYMASQPYIQVAAMIAMLQSLPVVDKPTTEFKDKK
tara:strand:- start:62 stop:208 length:147 start_codon:yes stop_codon:yes gene_type:complete